MMAAMCARRKQWLLEQVTERLQHGKIHTDDCVECVSQDRSSTGSSGRLSSKTPCRESSRRCSSKSPIAALSTGRHLQDRDRSTPFRPRSANHVSGIPECCAAYTQGGKRRRSAE